VISAERTFVLIPALNERENLERLLPEIGEMAPALEVDRLSVTVFDDGSTDGTFEYLKEKSVPGIALTVLRSAVTLGKAQALQYLLKSALEDDAEFLIMMDGDGQDNPASIQELLTELSRGVDVVNGRRSNRSHPLSKRASSKLFNASVRAITGIRLLDINSGLKGFSRVGADALAPYFYGELHRVIIVIAVWLGLETGEVRVLNRPRLFGTTKYGFARGWRGIFDLVTIQFLRRYHNRPGHFFSGVGSSLLVLGALSILFGLVSGGPGLVNGPLPVMPWVGAGAMALGLVVVSFGFVAELNLFLSKDPVTSVIRSSRKDSNPEGKPR